MIFATITLNANQNVVRKRNASLFECVTNFVNKIKIVSVVGVVAWNIVKALTSVMATSSMEITVRIQVNVFLLAVRRTCVSNRKVLLCLLIGPLS